MTHPAVTPIETDRLILRRWQAGDAEAFAALNADPQVMRFFQSVLTRAESDAIIARVEAHIDEYGYGFWAVEEKQSGQLVGMTGLAQVKFDAPFVPAVEIGWRFVSSVWGRGYAPEAARAAAQAGFDHFGFDEIVAFAVAGNAPSRRVMEKLGMTHNPADDFDHPRLPADSPLRRHVLYRLKPFNRG